MLVQSVSLQLLNTSIAPSLITSLYSLSLAPHRLLAPSPAPYDLLVPLISFLPSIPSLNTSLILSSRSSPHSRLPAAPSYIPAPFRPSLPLLYGLPSLQTRRIKIGKALQTGFVIRPRERVDPKYLSLFVLDQLFFVSAIRPTLVKKTAKW